MLKASQKSAKPLKSQCFQGFSREKPFQKSLRPALGSISQVKPGKLSKAVMSMGQGSSGTGTACTNAKLGIVTVMIPYGVMAASAKISKENLCSSGNMLCGQNSCEQYSVGDA